MAITPYNVSLENESAANANVADMYKSWTTNEIRADLDSKRTPLVSVFMNLTHEFNKASGIRASNAYLGNHVYLVGRRKYNKKGTVGTHQYEHVSSANTLEEVVELLHNDGYTVFAVDNIYEYEPKNIWDVELPYKSAFVYGEEMRGLQPEEIALCDDMVYCQMYGSVRSLNVAQCSAVVMNEYSKQHRNSR